MARNPLQLPQFNAMEREVFILNAVWELSNRMVNRSILRLHHNDPDSEVRFQSAEASRLFNIRLVDLLSPPNAQFARHENYVVALKAICENPSFRPKYAVRPLRKAARAFDRWLRSKRRYSRIWLPSIDRNCTIEMQRQEFLKICGNISKHNYTRLTDAAEKLRTILHRTGINVSATESLTLLDEFDDWFHDNIFHYHSSTIAEFINNIRLGIFDYLSPEFQRSYTRDPHDEIKYTFKRPTHLNNDYAFHVHWDLMNKVRSRPWMPAFTVTKALKKRY
jgi:hypothetical protein